MPETFSDGDIPRNPLRNNSLEFSNFISEILSENSLKNNTSEENIDSKSLKKILPFEFKNEYKYINKIKREDPEIDFSRFNIESREINTIFDRRIERILESDRIFQDLQTIHQRPLADQISMAPQTREPKTKVFRSKTGLIATPGVLYSGISIKVGGEEMARGGQTYTRVDFMPGGRVHFQGNKITDSVANGIEGLIELVAAVEKGQVEIPNGILLGHTNLNMALFSQRLGFKITDPYRNSDGEIDKSLPTFEVVARFNDVKKAIITFQEQGHSDRIVKRQRRLNPGAQPA